MSNRTLQALLATLIAAVVILTIVILVVPWGESDIVLDTARVRPESGLAYIVEVSSEQRFFAFRSDSANWPDKSDLLLLEMEARLGPLTRSTRSSETKDGAPTCIGTASSGSRLTTIAIQGQTGEDIKSGRPWCLRPW